MPCNPGTSYRNLGSTAQFSYGGCLGVFVELCFLPASSLGPPVRETRLYAGSQVPAGDLACLGARSSTDELSDCGGPATKTFTHGEKLTKFN